MNDGAVGNKDATEHIEAQNMFLTLLMQADAKLKSSKCSFGALTVSILGHKLTPESLLSTAAHVQAIQDPEMRRE